VKKKINDITHKITELETEKETYIYQIAELKKRYQRDMERLESEMASMNESCHNMEEKLASVEKIEEGIIKLYMEMKDRTIEVVRETDDDDRPIEDWQEKEMLRKENPLVILDRLKANLRTLLAFQEDFHTELKEQISTRKIEVEEKVEEMQNRINEFELEQEQLKQNESRAIGIRNDAVNSKRVIIDDSNKQIGELKAENVRLVQELKLLEDKIDELHRKLDDRDEKLRDRAIEMTKIDRLDDRMQKDRNKHQFDRNRLKSDHFKVREVYDKELQYYHKIKSDKAKMESELERFQSEIRELKEHADRQKVREMEKRDGEMQDRYSHSETNLKEVVRKLHSCRTKVINLRKENIRIKQRYQNLFMSSVNDEKKRQGEADRIIRHFKENTDNTPQAAYFKKLFLQKEKEVEDLSRRVKRMILVEKQETKYQKNFEVERNRLIEKLGKLKNEAMNTLPDDIWKTEEDLRKQNQALERRLRDYENMKSLAKSQQHAFEKLADSAHGGLYGSDAE
jgi:peptidoglycan hydrolase CwlO-like protein